MSKERTVYTVLASIGAAGIIAATVAACTPEVVPTIEVEQPTVAVPTATVLPPVTEPTEVHGATPSELGGLIEPSNIQLALDTVCETEDSLNCYWRADQHGNLMGDSFVNIEGHIFDLTSVLGGH